MPIPWKAIQRRNPRDPNKPAKYYALDVTRSVLDVENVTQEITARSGMSAGDVLNVLRTFADWLPQALSNGDSVAIDRIGVFSTSLTSQGGADTAEGLRRVGKDVSVNFRPAPELRTTLAQAGEQFTGEVTHLPSA